MANRTVVFIGTEYELYLYSGLYYPFKKNGWKTIKCESIEEAKRQDPIDAIVVIANGNLHVKEYEEWNNHPKAIWLRSSSFDKAPTNVKSFHALDVLDLSLRVYQEVLEICK